MTLRNAGNWLTQVEVGEATGDVELVAAAAPAVTELHGRGVRVVPGHASLVSRLAAVALRASGDATAARRWSDIAADEARSTIGVSGRTTGLGAEGARVALDRGRLLRESGDEQDAQEAEQCFSAAATAFDELGMLGLLRQAEAEMGTAAPSSGRRRLRTILFTDLVDSTAINVALGNEEYVALLRAHDRLARRLLRDHDGIEFKHTGDGLAAWFRSPVRAIDAALELQTRMEELLHADSGRRVRIRCGLAAGEPIEDDGDLFGLAVVRAARVCSVADAGEVVVADEVRSLVGDPTRFRSAGRFELKGLPGPQELHFAQRSSTMAR